MGFADSLWRLLPGQEYLLSVFLLSLRLGALLLLTPLLHAISVPPTARILLVLGLAAALVPGLPHGSLVPAAVAAQPGVLIAAAAVEVALGATLALGVFAAFGAISLAGRILDIQIGFGMAQVVDPATQRQIPIINSAFDQVGVLVFFLVNGHHALLRGLVYSLERFPLGRAWSLEAASPIVLKHVAGLFGLGFALAAPVVFCMLLVDLGLGVLARNLPQMNIFVVGLPIKIVAGLAALSLWFGGMGEAMERIYASIYTTWDAVFAAAPPPAGAR
jgi:flagellar biosynthetic protein FliR